MHALIRSSLLTLVLLPTLAHAQAYRCSSNGTTYYSDRPCAGESHRTNIGSLGPLQNPTASNYPSSYSRPLPSAPRPPDHTKYLNSECASIAEAIRTAPHRRAACVAMCCAVCTMSTVRSAPWKTARPVSA